MARAKAGPAPWSTNWSESNTKRVTKKTMRDQGLEWSLGSGYRQAIDLWDERPKKAKTKQVKHYSGKLVEVSDADFEDYLGFVGPMNGDFIQAQDLENRIAEANFTQVSPQFEGHIQSLAYAPTRQFMMVQFSPDNGGASVVHIAVPPAVYSELLRLGEAGTTMTGVDGKQRHVLGMRYWDIVRIRHTQHGVRYKFLYGTGNTSMATGSSMSDEDYISSKMTQEEKDQDMKDMIIGLVKNSKEGRAKFGRQAPEFAKQLNTLPLNEVKAFVTKIGLSKLIPKE